MWFSRSPALFGGIAVDNLHHKRAVSARKAICNKSGSKGKAAQRLLHTGNIAAALQKVGNIAQKKTDTKGMKDWKKTLAALSGANTDNKEEKDAPQTPPRRKREGVVYSTDPNFAYTSEDAGYSTTLPPARQRLRLAMERAGRAGKTVTLVRGFEGTEEDLQELCRELKRKCGVGGSAKDGVIVIQGDHRERLATVLRTAGYTQTK